MKRKIFFFVAYVLTSISMIVSALINDRSGLNIAILLPIIAFFLIALKEHFKELQK